MEMFIMILNLVKILGEYKSWYCSRGLIMTWVSEQTKKEILELAKGSDLYNNNGAFATYDGKLYYVNVAKGIVDPVIQHDF